MPSEYATLVPSREIAAKFSCTAVCERNLVAVEKIPNPNFEVARAVGDVD
jgi:hypothetical protein